MRRLKLLVGLVMTIILLAGGVYLVQAQYTAYELEHTKQPSLFPQAGPGETEIINQLKTTNRLLQEQNQLIAEQNRLLRASKTARK